MLFSLLDGRARTGTELAVLAEVSPSTASVHLNRLKTEGLVKVRVAGKHRYYSLEGPGVADVLESLSVLAGARRPVFEPRTPDRLRHARTCYDHMAGTLGVSLHDRLNALGWISCADDSYELTAKGAKMLELFDVDVEAARRLRRRFAFGCLDWSERRCHIGGALGAALLELALRRKWVARELDSRALGLTGHGRREMAAHFGLRI